MGETLNQQVYRLLHPDGCWHEWDSQHGMNAYCLKCKRSLTSLIDNKRGNPDYAHDLNALWDSGVVKEIYDLDKSDGQTLLNCLNIDRDKTAMQICQLYIRYKGEKPNE